MICHEAGYLHGIATKGHSSSSLPVLITNVTCVGTELYLNQCMLEIVNDTIECEQLSVYCFDTDFTGK